MQSNSGILILLLNTVLKAEKKTNKKTQQPSYIKQLYQQNTRLMKPPVSDKKIVRSVTKKTWETQKAEGDDSITLKRKKKRRENLQTLNSPSFLYYNH